MINKKIITNIIILKTENLTKLMIENGWSDFDIVANKTVEHKIEDWLDDESIKLINNFYEKDFKYFNYIMLKK